MKTGPCNPKPRQTRQSDRPAFDRWGDSPSRDKPSAGNADDTYRVYVGGLDEMSDLSQNEEELREMFKDFKMYVHSRVSAATLANTHKVPLSASA